MQNNSLRLRLNHIVSKIHTKKQLNSSQNYPTIAQQCIQQLTTQLNQYFQFISQQMIKLSAYYEAKLQYQAIDYEQEIGCLKQEIQRQYKVIGLMKLELEDLVILVNQQRNHPFQKHEQQGQDGYAIEERMREEEEHREWRVRKSESALIYTQKPSITDTHIYNKHQQTSMQKLSVSQSQQCPPSYTRSAATISGLQIIAEQQTERTLMSAGDEEGYPIEPDYFQDDEQHQNREIDNSQEKRDGFFSEPKLQAVLASQLINSPSSHVGLAQQKNRSSMQESQKERLLNENQIQNLPLKSANHFPHQNSLHYHTLHNINIYPSSINQTVDSQFHLQSLKSQDFLQDNQLTQKYPHQRIYSGSQNTTHNHLFSDSQTQHNFSDSPINHPSNSPINNSSQQSVKPQFKLIHNSQRPLQNNQLQQKQCHITNFVLNPFTKKTPQSHFINHHTHQQSHEYTSTDQQAQNIQNLIEPQKSSPQFLQKHTKTFQKQYRPQYKQVDTNNSKKQSAHTVKSTSSVMSILELIATNNFQPYSKRSQLSNKLTLSRSKSKGDKQSKKSIQKQSSIKRKKQSSKKPTYYNHQTQQQPQIDSQSNSRFTMVRCPTSEDITLTQRNNPKSFDETECFTSNDFRDHSEYESCDNNLRSFHTTFGRPSSTQFLKDITSFNNKQITLEKNFTNQRKGSIKWKKQSKQNQRQRRMSQKAPHSKLSTVVSKKTTTKYLKPNSSFALEQSVHSMLQSHLENSNKFFVGVKKQELKYDGERMVLGQQHIRHGHGTLYYSNGLIYEGQFFQHKRQGFGLLKFNHVQLYSGQWQNDQLSGKGKIRNCAIINKKKKQQSEGINANNNVNSSIINSSMFSKWISYCGEFMKNRFEGQGTLYLQGGQKFVGWFKNGVADGEGSLYRKNGEVENGVWRNNVLVERYLF